MLLADKPVSSLESIDALEYLVDLSQYRFCLNGLFLHTHTE